MSLENQLKFRPNFDNNLLSLAGSVEKATLVCQEKLRRHLKHQFSSRVLMTLISVML